MSSSTGTTLAACVGTSGYIYTSINSGVNWTERTGSGLQNFTGIASSSDGATLAACVTTGNIYTGGLVIESTNFKIAGGNDLSNSIAFKESGSVATSQYKINGYDLNVVLGSRVNTVPTGFKLNGVDLINIFM